MTIPRVKNLIVSAFGLMAVAFLLVNVVATSAASAVADLSVSDVTQAEGNTGTSTFAFTVSLDSPAPAGGVTFNASTANGTSNPATASSDYVGFTNQPGSIAQGQTATTVEVTVNGDTTLEPNETFFVNITNVTGATVSDGQGRGTILNDDGAPTAGQIIISEFRLRGPDPDGAGAETGELDEFIEIYNTTDSDFVVLDSSPLPTLTTSGWAIVSSDDPATAKYVIPVGTRIPARGHFLVTNLLGYSLSAYAEADTTPQGSIAAYNANIPDNAGLALFRTGNPAFFSTTAERLDAVGFTNAAAFFETTPLLPVGGITTPLQHSFTRKLTGGRPKDTQQNQNDFDFVEVKGATSNGRTAILGAPGPENAQSHIVRNDKVASALLAPTLSSSVAPNRERTGTGNSGTLSFRRTLRNNTGQPITSFRFRVNDLSTIGNEVDGASARLALADSVSFTYDPDSNPATANTTVLSTTLESPSAQTPGGGLNASLRVNLPQPVAAGARFSVNITFNILRAGNYRFSLNHEVLPQP